MLASRGTEPSPISIKGLVDGSSPVNLQGHMSPFSSKPSFNAELNFKHVELTRLNAYSGTYAGYVIERGKLSLALNYQLQGRQLQGDNQIVIEQLKLGKRTDSEKAASLPLELAVALLEDENGVIDLGLEVLGNIDDPEFAVGDLIAKALSSALTKVLTPPFSLLSALVGAEETLEVVNFAPGQMDLEQEQLQLLSKLAESLKKRPQLKLGLKGWFDTGLDNPALQRQALTHYINRQGGGSLAPEQLSVAKLQAEPVLKRAVDHLLQLSLSQEQLNSLEQQLRLPEGASERQQEQALLELQLQRLLDQQQVTEQQLLELAEQRADTVKRALSQRYALDTKRLFIERSDLETAQGATKVELLLIAD